MKVVEATGGRWRLYLHVCRYVCMYVLYMYYIYITHIPMCLSTPLLCYMLRILYRPIHIHIHIHIHMYNNRYSYKYISVALFSKTWQVGEASIWLLSRCLKKEHLDNIECT